MAYGFDGQGLSIYADHISEWHGRQEAIESGDSVFVWVAEPHFLGAAKHFDMLGCPHRQSGGEFLHCVARALRGHVAVGRSDGEKLLV